MGDNVYVVGAGMTPFGKFLNSDIRQLAEVAVREALDDAGISASDVDSVYFANGVAGVLSGQEMIRGQIALRRTGLLGRPIVNVENACASGTTAFHLACQAVRAGQAEIAIAVGAEKLTHEDKSKSFAAIGSATDKLADDPGETDSTRSSFMDLYASRARAYMERTGCTADTFAQVAVKSHAHAALNPKAQYRDPVTVEQVLASRTVVDPLTVLMCSPIGDGAAAVVVASERARRRLGAVRVKVEASVLTSGRERSPDEESAARRAATAAYEACGISPQDIQLVELHDAAASAELMIYEELMLCPEGDGAKLLQSGATSLGGRVPVNLSGGLLSKGHPLAATGCSQLVELVDQLRERCVGRQAIGAKVALAENGGGSLGEDPAAMTVTILSR